MNEEVIAQLAKQQEQLNELLVVANKGLLKSEILFNTKYQIEDALKKLTPQLSEVNKLLVEKMVPVWRNMPKTGVFLEAGDAIRHLTPTLTLVQELRSSYAEEDLKESVTEQCVIPKGEPYTGKKYLRDIFSLANESIFIRDTYLKSGVLDMLADHIEDKPSLKISLLVDEKNPRLPTLKTYLAAFVSQYSVDLVARCSSKNEGDHPRCIVIDDAVVFDATHSLDQWGERTATVHQMVDEVARKKLIQILSTEFESAEAFLD